MRIAYLNLCHRDPELVARAARRLTAFEGFSMYVHVDAKADIAPFRMALAGLSHVFLQEKRRRVYWGGFNAVSATVDMLREALDSPNLYEYYVILQNLDYPLRSNDVINTFFERRHGMEFIRACNIADTKDWHFTRKYRIYNERDDDFYLNSHTKARLYARYLRLGLKSLTTLLWNGVIIENGERYPIHYGAAQWAVTRACAAYIVNFYDSHPIFNARMAHIQFPDEEYFHTIVHNSPFKHNCIRYDEPVRRWLVNWRNLHYFEYPKEITVFTEKDFGTLMAQEDALFARKFSTGISDVLLDMLDEAAK